MRSKLPRIPLGVRVLSLEGDEMQIIFDMVYKYEALLWLICGLVAGATWWRFRTISWAIFAVLLLLKSLTCLMIIWPVQIHNGNELIMTHGFFTQGAMSDPGQNMWKLQMLGITDGLIPIFLILGFVARWLEKKDYQQSASPARRGQVEGEH